MAKKFLLVPTILLLTMIFAACGNSSSDPSAVSTVAETPTPVGDSASSYGAPVSATQIEEADLECLSSKLGEEVDLFALRRAQLGSAQPEQIVVALTECGIDPNALNLGTQGESRFRGGFTGGQFRDPEIQDCIAGVLGAGDSGLPRIQPGSTSGPSPELAAALDECGFESGDLTRDNLADPGGLRGFGAFGGGPLADPEVQECIAEALGTDAGAPSGGLSGGIPGGNEEFAAALEECGADFGGFRGLPPNGFEGIAPSDPLNPGTPPTPVQVSELSVQQLSCLSNALEPAVLGQVVVATTNDDTSDLPEGALAALIECGVE